MARFHGTSWNVDMTNEISARVIMNHLTVLGMGNQSVVNINWRCLERGDWVACLHSNHAFSHALTGFAK